MIRTIKAWFNQTFRRKKINSIIQELDFQFKDGAYEAKATIDIPGIEILTSMMVHAFQAAGGVNYVDFTVMDKASLEVYIMSIQRKSGHRQSDVNRILKDALVQILEMNRIDSGEYFIVLGALNRCGYLLEDGTLGNV